MNFRFIRHAFVPSLLLAVALVAFIGCDTSDPVPTVEPDEVTGTYDFTRFRFTPDRSGIVGVNLLDTLVVDATSLQLTDGGEFLLTFQFMGETFDDRIRGTFEVTSEEVTLTARSEDVDLLGLLLLSQGITLQRDSEDVLSLSEDRTVDLEAYDEEVYGGIEPQPGILSIRLERRALDPARAAYGH